MKNLTGKKVNNRYFLKALKAGWEKQEIQQGGGMREGRDIMKAEYAFTKL